MSRATGAETRPHPLWSSTDLVLPCFAIDFVSKRDAWEGKPGSPLELFLVGVASILIRNPQHSVEEEAINDWSLDASPKAKSTARSYHHAQRTDMHDDDDDEGLVHTPLILH